MDPVGKSNISNPTSSSCTSSTESRSWKVSFQSWLKNISTLYKDKLTFYQDKALNPVVLFKHVRAGISALFDAFKRDIQNKNQGSQNNITPSFSEEIVQDGRNVEVDPVNHDLQASDNVSLNNITPSTSNDFSLTIDQLPSGDSNQYNQKAYDELAAAFQSFKDMDLVLNTLLSANNQFTVNDMCHMCIPSALNPLFKKGYIKTGHDFDEKVSNFVSLFTIAYSSVGIDNLSKQCNSYLFVPQYKNQLNLVSTEVQNLLKIVQDDNKQQNEKINDFVNGLCRLYANNEIQTILSDWKTMLLLMLDEHIVEIESNYEQLLKQPPYDNNEYIIKPCIEQYIQLIIKLELNLFNMKYTTVVININDIFKLIDKYQDMLGWEECLHNSNSQFTVPTRFPAFMLAKIKKFDCPKLDTSILDWKLKSN